MSIGRPEKICPHDRDAHGTWRRFVKRSTQKKLRLLARRDPENAPRRLGNYGWSS